MISLEYFFPFTQGSLNKMLARLFCDWNKTSVIRVLSQQIPKEFLVTCMQIWEDLSVQCDNKLIGHHKLIIFIFMAIDFLQIQLPGEFYNHKKYYYSNSYFFNSATVNTRREQRKVAFAAIHILQTHQNIGTFLRCAVFQNTAKFRLLCCPTAEILVE